MPRFHQLCLVAALAAVLSACSQFAEAPETVAPVDQRPTYLIGPTDQLSIFVWRNPELSMAIPVRPDGRISMPLVAEMMAAGKTPEALARDLEQALAKFVQAPMVTVIVTGFVGPMDQQVRIVGEAAEPKALQYRDNMTVLDAMIQVGGLTTFAAGNRTVLIRRKAGSEAENYLVRLDDLLKGGDVSANVKLLPGDIIIIPQSWF